MRKGSFYVKRRTTQRIPIPIPRFRRPGREKVWGYAAFRRYPGIPFQNCEGNRDSFFRKPCIPAGRGRGRLDVCGIRRRPRLFAGGKPSFREVVDAGGGGNREEKIKLAKEVVAPEENRSVYYTLLSTKAASKAVGEQVAEYALRFVGNCLTFTACKPLLWRGLLRFHPGGIAAFGVRLPRLAQEQGVSGEMVGSLSEARPGILYTTLSGPHVGIYIGNGRSSTAKAIPEIRLPIRGAAYK